MHFNLSEERQMLKDTIDRFLSDHYGKIKNHHETPDSNENYVTSQKKIRSKKHRINNEN